jgi:hypothetical protein
VITQALLSAAILLGPAQGTPESAPTTAAPDLLAEAWLSTAGPYGEGWELRLMPHGDVSLRVFYSLRPSGSLMADFDIDEDHMARIRAAIDAQAFFDLPAEISPKLSALHMPDFRLEITLGNRKSKVQLYDPADLKDDSRAKRFLAVWAAIYDGLPLKPKW